MKKDCKIKGCSKPVHVRGWCWKHYTRWLRHGDPLTMKRRENGQGSVGPYRRVHVNGARQYDHVKIAEKALGHPLPKGAVVHHFDENKKNDKPSNLVICPDAKYHRLLHRRTHEQAMKVWLAG
jgi:hypothetical protein